MNEINLASGASSFHSPAAAVQAATEALQQHKTFYGPAAGTDSLRQAIADRYQQDGLKVKPEQVLVTPGTKQALFNLFSTLLAPGQEVVVPVPAWFGFHELLKYSSGKLVLLPTTAAENYTISEDALRKALTPQTRMLLITNPANPTGRLYSQQEIETLLHVLADYPDVYFVCDEIYDLYTYGKPFISALACQGPQERIIVVNGFSKTFAMSGWRVGYMVAPEAVIQKATDFQSATYSGVSAFVQDAAEAAMQNRNVALQPMRSALGRQRDIMQEALQKIPDISFFPPEGAYYFFPDLSAYLNTKTHAGTKLTSTADLCDYLQNEYKLIVANGDNFGAKGHVRISFALQETELKEALTRLQKALSHLRTLQI